MQNKICPRLHLGHFISAESPRNRVLNEMDNFYDFGTQCRLNMKLFNFLKNHFKKLARNSEKHRAVTPSYKPEKKTERQKLSTF